MDEPLPQFSSDVGELPKYRGFFSKDYQLQRTRNKTHPPEKLEDVVTIKHYAINICYRARFYAQVIYQYHNLLRCGLTFFPKCIYLVQCCISTYALNKNKNN